MDQNPDVQEDLGTGGKFKNWLQDNIRIILSVLIVLAIAGGIYSYSKRAESPTDEFALEEAQEQIVGDQNNDKAVTIIGDEEASQKDEQANKDEIAPNETQNANEQAANEEEKPAQSQGQEQSNQTQPKEDVKINGDGQQQSVSEETAESFVETSTQGDSRTTLARKALRDYLEKNNDSSLTAEHKIYIEDYLQKHAGQSGKLKVGDKISFSKTLLKDAVEKSKTLNDSQLNNLKQYSSRVSTI